MPSIAAPEGLWRARVDELARDLKRLEALLECDLVKQHFGLAGKFGQSIGPLQAGLQRLERAARSGISPEVWAELSVLAREHRSVCESQLEFLGGVAIGRSGMDSGLTRQAQDWLAGFCSRLGFDSPPVVITGRGPLVEPQTGIVRLPFADWDLWSLPPLGRALGVLGTAPGNSHYYNALNTFASSIPDSDWVALIPGVQPADRREYLSYYFADMFAVAVVGPVYGVALFTMELDYANPEQLDLRDPDQIEGRDEAPRYLPAPVHRAAAILATLRAMNASQMGATPYGGVIRLLEDLWRAAIRSSGRQDSLETVTRNHGPWHDGLYRNVIEPFAFMALQITRATWKHSSECLKALRSAKWADTLPIETTALLGAIWQLRLEQPDQTDNALDLANSLLSGKAVHVPLGSATTATPKEQLIAQVRLKRLHERWRRIERILRDTPQDGLARNQIPATDRAAVAGRFYRLLSEQEYKLAQWITASQVVPVRAGIWGNLIDLAADARPLQREALEFLGGCLIRRHELDCEPAPLGASLHRGPSICGLGDWLLRDYSRRSGIHWNARTVLGPDPFLETDTEVIRLRFPDWSLWDLPLFGHEFGHLAARATPAFLQYQVEQAEQCVDGHPSPDPVTREQRRRHMDEFFADVFATYTLGPAFASDVILLQFNPAEAYLARGGHPSHEERVRVILQTLAEMNRKAGGEFVRPLKQLERSWSQAIAACRAVPEDPALFASQLAQAKTWGRKIHGLVEKFYRLGTAYTVEHWLRDRRLAARLWRLPAPDVAEIAKILGVAIPEVSPADILNALWHARVPEPSEPEPGVDLIAVAHELGCRLQQVCEEPGMRVAEGGTHGS